MTPRRFKSVRTAGALSKRRESWAPRASGSAASGSRRHLPRSQPFEVASQPHRALAQGRHADLVEDRERRRERHHVEQRRRRHLPGGGARVGRRTVRRVEPVVGASPHQPVSRGTSERSGRVALVDEDRRRPSPVRRSGTCTCTRPRNRRRRRAARAGRCRGVGEFPADDRTDLVGRRREPLDRQAPGRSRSSRRRAARARCSGRARRARLEVLDADGVLAGPRADDEEVRLRVQAAPGEVARAARAGRTGRAARRSGSSAARPSGRKNEASIRCRFTVSVLRIATSDGRAPTIRAIGSRNVSS